MNVARKISAPPSAIEQEAELREPSVREVAEDAQESDEVQLRSQPRRKSFSRRVLESEYTPLIPAVFAVMLAMFQLYSPNAWLNLAIFAFVFCAYLIFRRQQQGFSEPAIEGGNHLAKRLEALEDASWEIRESEEIHRSLAEAFGDVVLHRTHAGDVTFSNKHFRRYFDARIRLPVVAPSMQTPDSPVPLGTDHVIQPQTRDIEISTLIGKRWFSWTDLVIRDPASGVTGIRSVARDITDRKTSEAVILEAYDKAKSANEAKSKFLAMVSHEIRTPLNGVIGMTQLLEDTSLDSTQASYVDAITKSGRSLLGLIEDLLDTARIEAGQMTIQTRPTDVRQLVEDVADIIATRAREKSVDLATFIDPDLPMEMDIDPDRVRQVLLNLAGNAVKFTEEGGIAIFVERGDSGLDFKVIDTGPGLSKEDRDKIFDDFAQASTGSTRAHEGAGLGLAISRKLARLMGGYIAVESTPGEGSEFCFSIPLPDQETKTEKSLSSYRGNALILMKPTPARKAFVRSVSALGYMVQTCNSENQFRALVRSSDRSRGWSAIVADRGCLQGDLNDTGPAPVYLLGDAMQRHASDAQANVDGWLTWPVRAATLAKVLDRKAEQTTPTPTKEPEPVETALEIAVIDEVPDSIPTSDVSDCEPQTGGSDGTRNVMIAEDNPINAMLLKNLLAKLGHNVTHVTNGRLAVETFEASAQKDGEPFDLILMDLHMPELDGTGAITEIRAAEEKANLDPSIIIVLSADGQQDVREEALKQGADDFLMKPLDLQAIAWLLRKRDVAEAV